MPLSAWVATEYGLGLNAIAMIKKCFFLKDYGIILA
jgi:hypothetical protein